MSELSTILNEFLREEPIVIYKPIYREITGSVNAGLLCGNLIYWSKTKKHGEFYKTDKELCRELGMRFDEFRAAKKTVIGAGIFSIEVKSLPSKTYYKLNLEKLVGLIEKNKKVFKNHNLDCGNSPKQDVEIPHPEWGEPLDQVGEFPHTTSSTTTSITTENTTDTIVELASNSTVATKEPQSSETDTKTSELLSEQKEETEAPSAKTDQILPLFDSSEELMGKEGDDNQNGSNRKNLSQSKSKKEDPTTTSMVSTIFAYWQEVLNHPKAKLDSKRRALIVAALKMGYTVDELKKAIDGISKTPHNMGRNDRGEVYDGLHVLFRNSEQIERFMRNADSPPTPQQKHTHTGQKKTFVQQNQEQVEMMREVTAKYFPKFSKYFPSPNSSQAQHELPQLRQEVLVNGI